MIIFSQKIVVTPQNIDTILGILNIFETRLSVQVTNKQYTYHTTMFIKKLLDNKNNKFKYYIKNIEFWIVLFSFKNYRLHQRPVFY